MPVGNEGAGVVVRAGKSPQAQALLGKTVATFGGEMYSQYRCAKAAQCVELPDDCTAADGAAMFVNPLTALCMVDVMRKEGHKAIVHTVAASKSGADADQAVSEKENISLVNIVRSQSQHELLKEMGAKWVCNSASPHFLQDLTNAIEATGATLVFDPIGGGDLLTQIMAVMEKSLVQFEPYSRYGSATRKQAYIYGVLDRSPTTIRLNFWFGLWHQRLVANALHANT